MKRGLVLMAAFTLFIASAAAQDYTYLNPPTLAVMDFEVSMKTEEVRVEQAGTVKDTRAYYGQLISQALLSVLVQQNAASVVRTPRRYLPTEPLNPLTVPGMPVYDPATIAQEKNPKALVGTGQDERYYVPPIFKIYDKKYVENALQNGNFTTKELYTKAANAFAFADLDYLVLGNVYDTHWDARDAPAYDPKNDKDKLAPRDAIGINVRVLNTKRAEELYAYSAIIDRDLHDLPLACARICENFMTDILNSHCGQFMTQPGQTFGKGSIGSGENLPEHTLFWQSQQVPKEDATLGSSDHSNKRELTENKYYWILPGRFTLSIYSGEHQLLKEVPFSLGKGEIKIVPYEKEHFEVQKGTVTISGVAPTASYTINLVPDSLHALYWWEIFSPARGSGAVTVKYDNGDITFDPAPNKEKETTDYYKAEYRPGTQELVLSNIPFGTYTVKATRNPPAGTGGIEGLWLVQLRVYVEGKTLPLVLQDPKGVKIQMADFGIQEKKALDVPQTTKISFVLDPGFDMQGVIQVSDSPTEPDKWLYWGDKEKITLISEYTQADWDAQPWTTFTIWVSNLGSDYYDVAPWWIYKKVTFQKSQVVPGRDIVEIVDVGAMKAEAEKKGKERYDAIKASERKPEPVLTAATQTKRGLTLKKTVKQPAAAKPAVTPKAAAAPVQGGAAKLFIDVGTAIGYGAYRYWNAYASSTWNSYTYTYTYTGAWEDTGGFDVGVSASALYFILPSVGVGAGLLMDYIIGSDIGFAGTLNVGLGDPSKGGAVFLLDIGYGSGFTVGGGVALMTPGTKSGVTIGASYFSYSDTQWSASLTVGYMLGF